MPRMDSKGFYPKGMGEDEIMPQTSTEKRAGRRKRVYNLLKSFTSGMEFTSQDVTNKCNLSNSISTGQLINQYMDALNIERITTGKYRVI
jgi:hypothetical protein